MDLRRLIICIDAYPPAFLLFADGILLEVQAAFPAVIVGKRSCDLLQPFWVKRMKERNVCCCIYHVEFQELLQGLNYLRL